MTSLVVQTSFLGDMVLTTPLIAHLARSGPVDVVSTPAAATLLDNNPDVRRVIVYDKRRRDSGVGGFLRLASTLRQAKYDVAYLAQGSLRSGALAAVSRIPIRIGFTTSAGRAFYTTRVPYIDETHHAARLLALAGSADVPRPKLFPGSVERRAVDELVGVAGGERLVGLAPGSVWGTKRWPHYATLSTALSELRPVVIGSADDTPLAAEIVAATGGRAIDATGQLSLLASAELVARCAVLVTNDSLPQHLASAMNVPTVAVFGPTVPEFGFGPLADRAMVAGHTGLACRPCDRHGPAACPLGHWRCMREITADSVAVMVRALSLSS
jgi:heptosyltransferase-2